MTEYPKAYIIPVGSDLQRSDAEANRMAQWVLDNGILLRRATADFTWNGTTYPAGSYVVLMNQPLRGLAFTALGPGLDYSFRINQLYAPPGGWSHGLMWGADTVEVPNGGRRSRLRRAHHVGQRAQRRRRRRGGGLVRGQLERRPRANRTILDLLRDGVYGEIAEAAFVNADGGPMPAGSIIFPNDPNTVAALDAAGDAGGLTFERGTRSQAGDDTPVRGAEGRHPRQQRQPGHQRLGVLAPPDLRLRCRLRVGRDGRELHPERRR